MLSRYIFAAFVICFGFSSFVAQDRAEPTKKGLIERFATLTKTNRLDVKIQLSLDDVNDQMKALIDDEKDLHEEQKSALQVERKAIFDKLSARTEKELNESKVLSKLGYDTVISVFDKVFSEAELIELIRFYESALGQKAVAFLARVTDEISSRFRVQLEARIGEVSKPQIDSAMDELRKRIDEVKKK
ncbi:MAG: DUF2059 domain-containing protein [Acidobacteriota bacterium]|nr:MAG: DUF2059 domain-containing protein [Acidobacteriota bacterium]